MNTDVIIPFPARYYTLLRDILQDKKNWMFTTISNKVVATRPSLDGCYMCRIEWTDDSTFEISFCRPTDRRGTKLLYLKSSNHLLLGLAYDFKNLYEYRNAPDSSCEEKLEHILSHFVF